MTITGSILVGETKYTLLDDTFSPTGVLATAVKVFGEAVKSLAITADYKGGPAVELTASASLFGAIPLSDTFDYALPTDEAALLKLLDDNGQAYTLTFDVAA